MSFHIGVIPDHNKYTDDEEGFWMPVVNMGPGGYPHDDGCLPLLEGKYSEVRKHMRLHKLGDYLHKVEVVKV